MKIIFAALASALPIGLLPFGLTSNAIAQTALRPPEIQAPALFVPTYETKPDDPELAKFYPAKAPTAGPMLLRRGDRIAIVGDSITEQKMYSRIIETYLHCAYPDWGLSVRQYGWSGEKTDGFLRRMDRDCLTFDPTLVTLSYGMNDARYRPFDLSNGRWYRSHYSAIVHKLKSAGARVVVGSPGCSGKIASWVKSKSGTLDEHNLNLCVLRDIAIEVAADHDAAFADVFWPMLKAQVSAPKKYATADNPYLVAGNDGIHPGWAGHVMMAHAYLTAMGIDGDLGAVSIDIKSGQAKADRGHTVTACNQNDGKTLATVTSTRTPFCADGPVDSHNSIRSGMTLVPFCEDLNRFTLTVLGTDPETTYDVSWGDQTKQYTGGQLAIGVNLADDFFRNPFTDKFNRVDEAVAAKQKYETHQVKKVFHGKEGKQDFGAAVKRTEAERSELAKAIQAALKPPVEHTITVGKRTKR